jgi:hypothetical protein
MFRYRVRSTAAPQGLCLLLQLLHPTPLCAPSHSGHSSSFIAFDSTILGANPAVSWGVGPCVTMRHQDCLGRFKLPVSYP